MGPGTLATVAVLAAAHIAGLAGLWLRLRSRERMQRAQARARLAALRTIAAGGRLAEHHVGSSSSVVIEVPSADVTRDTRFEVTEGRSDRPTQ